MKKPKEIKRSKKSVDRVLSKREADPFIDGHEECLCRGTGVVEISYVGFDCEGKPKTFTERHSCSEHIDIKFIRLPFIITDEKPQKTPRRKK